MHSFKIECYTDLDKETMIVCYSKDYFSKITTIESSFVDYGLFNKKEFIKQLNIDFGKSMIINNMENPVIDKFGNKRWYKEGKLHREDGPAIDYANGNKEYHISINETISLIYIPDIKSSMSMFNEKIHFPCNSPKEFFNFYHKGLFKLYLTF